MCTIKICIGPAFLVVLPSPAAAMASSSTLAAVLT